MGPFCRLQPARRFDARSRLKRHRRDAVRSATLSLCRHLLQEKLQRSKPGLPGLTRARTAGALHAVQRRRSILPAVKIGTGCDMGMRLPLPWRQCNRTLCRRCMPLPCGDGSIMLPRLADWLVNRAQFRKIGGGQGSRSRFERDAAVADRSIDRACASELKGAAGRAVLLVRLGNDAKAENGPAALVGHFHAQFRPCFNRPVEIAENFAGGFYRLQLNRADVGQFDSVAVLRGVVTLADYKKVLWHFAGLVRPHATRNF
jgi:hypothetical protein